MDTKFQSSFIPKSGVLGKGSMEKKESSTWFGILAVIIFLISLLFLGGVFAYKKITESSITNLETELALAESSLDKNGIDSLSAFDQRIKAIGSILSNHVSVSSYLSMLEDSTVSTIEFQNLKYSAPVSNGPISITMNGKASGYSSVAEQEEVLLKNPNTDSVSFANLSLDKNSGKVSFELKGTFKGSLVKFKAPNIGTSTPETGTSTTHI